MVREKMDFLLTITKPKRKYRKKIQCYLWSLKVTVYTELRYDGFDRNILFIELKVLRIMTISEMHFRDCHLSGNRSFSKLQYSMLILGLNNIGSKVIS